MVLNCQDVALLLNKIYRLSEDKMTREESKQSFEIWWEQEGTEIRKYKGECNDEFRRRVSRIAWENGIFKEKESQK